MKKKRVRITSLFIAFLVLVLSCIPCRDVSAMGNNIPVTTISQGQLAHHPNKGEIGDLCSPFCTCSCCKVMSEVSLLLQLELIKPVVSVEYNIAVAGEVISLSLSVWQPPKLG